MPSGHNRACIGWKMPSEALDELEWNSLRGQLSE